MKQFRGTRTLLRTLARFEGRSFAPWAAVLTLLSVTSVMLYPWLFPNALDRIGFATAVGSNPALGLIFGPAFDLMTDDGFNTWRSLALGGFFAGLAVILTTVRTTRGQEDNGQAELLASGVLGRSSRLLSSVILSLVGSVILGLIPALFTVLFGGGWESSFLLCATFTATGWMFTGLAALLSQVAIDARTASSIAVGVLGALFVLRGFAYSMEAPSWTVWSNPLGWLTETRAGTENNWSPLILTVILTAALLAAAFTLQSRRDFGHGIIAAKPGPTHGAIRTPFGLAIRLNRGVLVGWLASLAVIGIVFGYFTTAVPDLLTADEGVAKVLASGATSPEQLVSRFLKTILSMVGILASIIGVQVMLKVRTEEYTDRVEPVLSTAVSRREYFASNIALALLTSATGLVIAGLIIASFASRTDLGVSFLDGWLQAWATIPATWTIVAISVAVVGARPHVPIAAWAGVIASFALTILGPTFKLWNWALGISPYWHVPATTAQDPDWFGLIGVALALAIFTTIGCVRFTKRDIAV